jgi:hypothetical protein
MRVRRIFQTLLPAVRAFLAGLLIFPATCLAGAADARHEIHVKLFGQPCLLAGPLDEAALKVVHSVSPEQLYPATADGAWNEGRDQARRALEKIRSTTGLPPVFDRYRERLGKRLEAQLALYDGIESVKTTHKSAGLLTGTRRFVPQAKAKEFEALAKKLESAKAGDAFNEAATQLLDSFDSAIEPDPEEEFHRAIHRLSVQYTCSFEESDESE